MTRTLFVFGLGLLIISAVIVGAARAVGTLLPDDGVITFQSRGDGLPCNTIQHLLDPERNLDGQFCIRHQVRARRVISPDGRYLAYEVNLDGELDVEIYIRDRKMEVDFRLTDEDEQLGVTIWNWSPSSQYLLIYPYPLGRSVRVADIPNKRILLLDAILMPSYQWSPDGHQIVYGTRRNGQDSVFVRDLITDEEQQTDIQGRWGFEGSWSPDGRQIAATAQHGERTSIDVFDLNENVTRQWIYHADFDYRVPAWSPDGRWLAYVSIDAQQRSRTNIMNIETGEEQLLGAFWGIPFWSWDSRYLGYSNQGETIYVLDMNRSTVETLNLDSNIRPFEFSWLTDDQVANLLLQYEANDAAMGSKDSIFAQ